jgi:hypothetical protein
MGFCRVFKNMNGQASIQGYILILHNILNGCPRGVNLPYYSGAISHTRGEDL